MINPDGRIYTNYSWKIRPDLPMSRRFNPDSVRDYVQVATQHVIPNGKWVMERPYGWVLLVGVKTEELRLFGYADGSGAYHRLYISDKPFGYVVVDEVDQDSTVNPPAIRLYGRRTLVCAQQIHQGELGQTVPIERLSYARQALEPDESPNVRNRRKHGQRGWIRLTELAATANLSVEDVVFGFWDYSGHRNYRSYDKDQEGGQLLDIVVAPSRTDIEGKCPSVLSSTQFEASRLIGESVENLWVRRGFAYTVLRLLALGVRPETRQLA